MDAKQQATYVSDVRQAVRFAVSDMKGTSDLLPGFCLPKGIAPILPIFREAILNGDGDEKEAAAQGLGEVIKLTSAQALQPSVVHITGPLIRILGDRFSSNVKTAVLETLAILLAKVLTLRTHKNQNFVNALILGGNYVETIPSTVTNNICEGFERSKPNCTIKISERFKSFNFDSSTC